MDIVKVFKALADENRITILKLISSEERCACVLLEELSLSQSGLSYHMKILIEAGLVNSRDEGKWTYYRVNNESFQNIKILIDDILS